MNEKEFFIMGVVEGDRCSVIGRCGDVPIRVGDLFQSLYKYQVPKSASDYRRKASRENGQVAVEVKVESIQAYGRQLDHLSPGMTGTLVMSGAGCAKLGPNQVLGSGVLPEAIKSGDVQNVPPHLAPWTID